MKRVKLIIIASFSLLAAVTAFGFAGNEGMNEMNNCPKKEGSMEPMREEMKSGMHKMRKGMREMRKGMREMRKGMREMKKGMHEMKECMIEIEPEEHDETDEFMREKRKNK